MRYTFSLSSSYVVERLLANANPETRQAVNQLLRYPEDSAGSIMTVEYVSLKESLTVDQAIERIRAVGLDSETINICYVLDARRKSAASSAIRLSMTLPASLSDREVMMASWLSNSR